MDYKLSRAAVLFSVAAFIVAICCAFWVEGAPLQSQRRISSREAARIEKLGRACAAGQQQACASVSSLAAAGSDRLARVEAARWVADQAVLVRLATTDTDQDVRKTAARGLTDQSVLAAIAGSDRESEVRHAAIDRLTDQPALAQLARTGGDREKAARRLLSQRVLSCMTGAVAPRPAEDEIWARLKRERVRSSVEVFFVADEVLDVDLAAVYQKAEQALVGALSTLDLTPVPDGSNAQAVAEFTAFSLPKDALYVTAGRTTTGPARTWVGALTIRLQGQCVYCTSFSAGLSSPAAPMGSASQLGRWFSAAAEQLKDQTRLVQAVNNADASSRCFEVYRLKDQAVLATLFRTNQDSCVRMGALNQLKISYLLDEAFYTDMAQTDPDPEWRISALSWLTDPRLLARIAASDPHRGVRAAANLRLSELLEVMR